MLTETRTAPEKVVAQQKESDSTFWIAAAAFVSLVLAVIAYRAAAANYFTGDDFVYLHWLKTAWADPTKLWTVFWTNSLDASSTYFYRPLLSLSMALDKVLWGSNALGFHATNLFFHLLCSTLIYFFVRDILLPKKASDGMKLWPILSAAIFLLHPLHPEVVTWIGGRVDTVATSFFVGALYGYGRWRASDSARWFSLAMASFILCLCSKELSIMVPAALVAFELLLPQGSQNTQDGPEQACELAGETFPAWLAAGGAKVKRAVINTWRFWAVLALYFLVRRISLGTFVGGYDNSLSLGTDLTTVAVHWMDSLSMMLLPANTLLLNERTAIPYLTWLFLTVVQIGSLCVLYLTSKDWRPKINYLVSCMVLLLVPVYKLMSISGDLESSRLGYLATFPLSCLLALSCCTLIFGRGKMTVSWIVGMLTLLLSAYFLNLNNTAWQKAGKASNSIQNTFKGLERSHVLEAVVFGLPDNLSGAYCCRNALGQMHDSSLSVTPMPALSGLYCSAFTKDALVKSLKNNDRMFSFNADKLRLDPIALPPQTLERVQSYSGEQLKSVFVDEQRDISDKGLQINNSNPKVMKLPVPRQAIEAIVMVVNANDSMPTGNLGLIFNNESSVVGLVPAQELSLAPIGSKDQTGLYLSPRQANDRYVVFPVRGQASWQFDGQTSDTISLCSGSPWKGSIKSVIFAPMTQLAPTLTFAGIDKLALQERAGPLQQPGLLQLTGAQGQQTVHIDAGRVPGAKGILLEISRRNVVLHDYNASTPRNDLFEQQIKIDRLACDHTFSSSEFEAPSIYAVRAWALDSRSRRIGLASDHIQVSVEN